MNIFGLHITKRSKKDVCDAQSYIEMLTVMYNSITLTIDYINETILGYADVLLNSKPFYKVIKDIADIDVCYKLLSDNKFFSIANISYCDPKLNDIKHTLDSMDSVLQRYSEDQRKFNEFNRKSNYVCELFSDREDVIDDKNIAQLRLSFNNLKSLVTDEMLKGYAVIMAMLVNIQLQLRTDYVKILCNVDIIDEYYYNKKRSKLRPSETDIVVRFKRIDKSSAAAYKDKKGDDEDGV